MSNISLVHGDCLKVLKNMKDSSVEIVVTSPPYNLNKKASGGGNSKQNYDGWYSDDMPEEEYQQWQKDVIVECLRVAKGSVFYNHRVRYAWSGRNKYRLKSNIYHPMQWLCDFPIWCEIVWDRGGTTGHANRRCRLADERVYQLGKPNKFFDMGYTTVWKMHPSKNDGHVCTFPEELVERCILMSTEEGDTVLDPFSGIGTTCSVASRLNRKSIGIEVLMEYYDLSVEKLKNIQQGDTIKH